MNFVDRCKERQEQLKEILMLIENKKFPAQDEFELERLRQNTIKAITIYEKLIHLGREEQIGTA